MSSAPDNSTWLHGARQRASRRKSKWNLLLFVFAILAIASTWIGAVESLASYRATLYATGAFLSGGTRIGNILMHVAPAFPSLAVGMIVANLLIWCIPPARRALNEEDKPYPGLDFRSSNRDLAKFGLVLLVIAMPLAWLGARNCWSLTDTSIVYRAMFSPVAKQYSWADIQTIRTDCRTGRDGRTYDFVAGMADGTAIDFSSEMPDEFLAAYRRIQVALAGHSYQFTSNCLGPTAVGWRKVIFQRPTEAP